MLLDELAARQIGPKLAFSNRDFACGRTLGRGRSDPFPYDFQMTMPEANDRGLPACSRIAAVLPTALTTPPEVEMIRMQGGVFDGVANPAALPSVLG